MFGRHGYRHLEQYVQLIEWGEFVRKFRRDVVIFDGFVRDDVVIIVDGFVRDDVDEFVERQRRVYDV